MPDAALKSAPYASYTTAQLKEFVADGGANLITRGVMVAEIERRAAVGAGDWSVMTPAEKLRAIKKGS